MVRLWARVLRANQWIKNALLLAAPLAAGELFKLDSLPPLGAAIISFSAVSSATYILNDIRDAASDRHHPRKRRRPIAAGDVSVGRAGLVGVVLFLAGLGVGLWVGVQFTFILSAYALLTTAYSLWLKHEPVIELAVLSAGFLLRALAGAAAVGIDVSAWFLIVTGFASLFVAAGKRFSELHEVQREEHARAGDIRRSLEAYSIPYLRFVWGLSAAVATTAYCLWAFEISEAIGVPALMELSVVPFVLGVLRYALDIDRGKASAPEEALSRDKTLLFLGFVWVIVFAAGIVAA